MKTLYVLFWGEHWQIELRGVTADSKIAALWQRRGESYYYEEVELIENPSQYGEWLKE